jgi:CheY-like chemotaxis protein
MARILLVDDDPGQLEIRRLILERSGYEVVTAAGRDEALARVEGCGIVVTDLLLPTAGDGVALIDALRAKARIIVLSGADVPASVHADECLAKPCPSRRLLDAVARLALLLLCVFALRAETFSVAKPAEMVAELDLRAPGKNWSKEGNESALATLVLDGKPQQNVMVHAGADRFTYSVFLGRLNAGEHQLKVEGAGVELLAARFQEDASEAVAHAPVLYARPNTVGHWTDIPLIVYCERLEEAGQPILQYTVIYSNEDAGTSTRALMARWGRTTDIEWVYKVFLGPGGETRHATIQAAEHKEIEFSGHREARHPVLITWTDNNNVADNATSAVRYQIRPFMTDLTGHSREEVMDHLPFSYRIMADELKREHKLRPWNSVDEQTVSDPRNYLYFELQVTNRDSALATLVRLRGSDRWFSSNLGHTRYAIERDGWVRTTVELPPGTSAADIAEIGFECLTVEKKLAGSCRLERVGKAFFLDREYRPRSSIWLSIEPHEIPSGQIWTSTLR